MDLHPAVLEQEGRRRRHRGLGQPAGRSGEAQEEADAVRDGAESSRDEQVGPAHVRAWLAHRTAAPTRRCPRASVPSSGRGPHLHCARTTDLRSFATEPNCAWGCGCWGQPHRNSHHVPPLPMTVTALTRHPAPSNPRSLAALTPIAPCVQVRAGGGTAQAAAAAAATDRRGAVKAPKAAAHAGFGASHTR